SLARPVDTLDTVTGAPAPAEISSLMGTLVLDSWQIYIYRNRLGGAMSRNLLLGVLVVGFSLCWTAAPISAHHSFSAEFDGNKAVKVTGIVKKVEWMNPHIWFYVEGKDE